MSSRVPACELRTVSIIEGSSIRYYFIVALCVFDEERESYCERGRSS